MAWRRPERVSILTYTFPSHGLESESLLIHSLPAWNAVAKKKAASRPRRTREHIIASQSHNHLEKFFIDKGHTVDRPTEDYGIDLFVSTFDEDGYAEPGNILFQLKASDNLKYSDDGSFISFKVETKHYDYWMKQPMPVFLILYDAIKTKAYWLYVQEYSATTKKPKKNAETTTVRVPVANEFTAETVDYTRGKKAAILELEVEHEE
jgi:hypothetical protein